MANALRRRTPLVLAAAAVAVAVAGCATAPSGGPPRRATGEGTQVQAYVQPLPPPGPTSSWEPAAVVLGFLHASASYAFDPAAAERYLVPSLRKKWRPGSGPVVVVGGKPRFSAVPYRAQIPGPGPAQQLQTVKVTGQGLATLSQTGQYQYSPGQDVQYEFTLSRTDGVWLIRGLPGGQPGLLLTQSDFEAVYQARNLFFYTSDSSGVLVPDPVYAPLQSSNSALNTNLATHLVNGLLKGQGDWLSGGATWSAFPPDSRLIGQVTIAGRIAKVDLGGAAVHATKVAVQQMQDQLQATLDDRSYSQPLATQVQLSIDHELQYANPDTAKIDLVPAVATGPVFLVTSSDFVAQLAASPRSGAIPGARLGPAQIGGAQVTTIAADPGDHPSQLAIAVQDRTGCAVYLKSASQQEYHAYVLSTTGGVCTSLSWDNNGNLWAAAGQAAWVLRPQNRTPVAVGVAALSAVGQSGSRILALRMAPDGVRAALLVHTQAGNQLLLAAVRFDHGLVSFGQPVSIGAGGADPIAVSWLDPYHVAVLAGGAIFSVPLTGSAGLQPGGSPQSLGTAPAGAQTLTTDGSELVAGTGDGQIFASSLTSPGWSLITTGSDPIYPG
ncbi:MAG TPA: LpqB family beta-propeller domain-containing protein [Streptosporangiaceae bacterium]|nr:LpqB family beta-propeller domain-containing protein [Streptosporangiaceae bacterium]